MKLNIAIPDNPVLLKYFKPIEEFRTPDLNIIKLNEKNIAEYFLNARLDAAFLTPIGYGMGVGKIDYRIIPGFCLAAEGFTSLASIFYKPGLKTIHTIASPDNSDFVIQMGGIILTELCDLDVAITHAIGNRDEILTKYDAAILWESALETDTSQDISEEWTMANNMMLPLGCWVCRNEENPEILIDVVNSLTKPGLGLEQFIEEEYTPGYEEEPRQGRIIFNFSPEVEQAMDETLEFLYYHTIFPEIPTVKILGRDE